MMTFLLLLVLLPTVASFAPHPILKPIGTRLQVSLADDDKNNEENISIEYCSGCRWMMRSAWMANELLTTFKEEEGLGSVTLIPSRSEKGGVFLVQSASSVLWDRAQEGGFPESKQLKQRVRNLICPDKDLGHSDISSSSSTEEQQLVEDCEDCPTAPTTASSASTLPNVSITYCIGCKWLLRASWMAQELLTTFSDDLNSVTLSPSRPNDSIPGGTFRIELKKSTEDEVQLLWDRKEQGRFPEAKEVKQMIRDQIAPKRDLGHSDYSKLEEDATEDEMDDDEAEEARKFFGVM